MSWWPKEQNVYYCWFCDAHRTAVAEGAKSPCCSRCGSQLPAEARLKQPLRLPARPPLAGSNR